MVALAPGMYICRRVQGEEEGRNLPMHESVNDTCQGHLEPCAGNYAAYSQTAICSMTPGWEIVYQPM